MPTCRTQPAAHIASVKSHAIHQVSGTLAGQAIYTQNTVDTTLGTDVYSLTGRTNHGPVTLTSQDSVVSPKLNATTFHDIYHGGNAKLTLSNGSVVSIAYVGSGRSSSQNPNYTATFRGVGTGITGPELGHRYSFTATVVGHTGDDNAVKIRFSLKG